MGATEDLLRSMPDEVGEDGTVYLTIDPDTREITVPSNEKTFGVETDKDSERKYFRCPRIVGDNIDLSQHKIYISYVSTTSKMLKIFPKADDSYWCDDVAVDGDYITFSWKLSGNVFKEPGFVAFKVLAKKTDGDVLKTRWNTAPAFGTVLLTVPDGESVEERYPDIVTQLLERMDAVEAIATEEAMQGYVNEYLGEHPVQLDKTLTDNTKAAPAGVVGELKTDLNEYKDGFKKNNLWEKAELIHQNKYVNISDGKLVYQENSYGYGSWILPVDGSKKYSCNANIRFALPLSEDKETATSTSLLQNKITIDFSEYPNTKYLAFSVIYTDTPCVISEGGSPKEGFSLPKWAQEIAFSDLSGKITSDMVDGYEKGNLFSEAELYAENAYVNLSDGHIISSHSSAFNIYIIKVDTDSKYTFNNDVRFALPLGDDKYTATSSSLIANVKQIDISQYPNTIYLAFSFNKITYPVDSFIVSKGTIAKEKDTYPEWIIGALKTEKDIVSKGIVSKTGLFSSSGDNIILSSARSNLRKGIRLVFEATVTSGTDFEIGFSVSESSANTYPHNIISVTSDNISYNNVNYPHGLSIADRVQMIFEYLSNGSVDITFISNGNMFKQNVAFTMSNPAVPYVKSNGLIATECKLSFICTDIRKKIWMFGDSYFAYSTARWTYYLKEYGYDTNVLLDGFPGMGSVNARASFAKLLQLGTPKIAIWFMGMNDGTDTDDTTPNANWVTERNNFIALCETNGIEPIFATIPNVPSINHKGKNKWVRESGYRYVDMCHAVGADVDVNWYGDMLSPDKIHPSESGAKALFAQVLLDLPEVMLDNL